MRFQSWVENMVAFAAPDPLSATIVTPYSRRMVWHSEFSTVAPANAAIAFFSQGVLQYQLAINPAWTIDGAEHSALLSGFGPSAALANVNFPFAVQFVTTGALGGPFWVGFDT